MRQGGSQDLKTRDASKEGLRYLKDKGDFKVIDTLEERNCSIKVRVLRGGNQDLKEY